MPNIFHQQCDPTQFSMEETEASFSSIHNTLATVLGTASFFLSLQSANPQPNFNFLNPQPQVRNDVSGLLNPQPQVRNFVILEVRNFVIFEVRNRKSATFYEPSRRVL